MPVLYLVFWIILNGRITLEVIALGIVITAFISFLAYRFFGLKWQTEKKVLNKLNLIISYLFNLVIEVFKAGIHMVKIIMSPKIEIKPVLVYFKSPVRSSLTKVALSNSIILTPGTIIISLDDDGFVAHCIDIESSKGIENSDFVRRLKEIEGGCNN